MKTDEAIKRLTEIKHEIELNIVGDESGENEKRETKMEDEK